MKRQKSRSHGFLKTAQKEPNAAVNAPAVGRTDFTFFPICLWAAWSWHLNDFNYADGIFGSPWVGLGKFQVLL